MNFKKMMDIEAFIKAHIDGGNIIKTGLVGFADSGIDGYKINDDCTVTLSDHEATVIEIKDCVNIPFKFDMSASKDSIRINNCKLKDLKCFDSHVDELRLYRNSLKSLSGLPSFRTLQIKECNISDFLALHNIYNPDNILIKMTDIPDIKMFNDKLKLFTLILSDCKLKGHIDIPFNVKTYVCLEENEITSLSMKYSVSSLNLINNNIESLDCLDIDWSNIINITLNDNPLKDIDRIFKEYEKGNLRNLKTISFNNTFLSEKQIRKLYEFEQYLPINISESSIRN